MTTDWTVAFHRARGLKFRQIQFRTRRQDGYTTDWTISGRACGPDPWVNWTIETAIQSSLNGWQSPPVTNSYPQLMRRAEGGSEQDIGSGGKIRFMIQPRAPAKFVLEMVPWTGYPLTTNSVVTVPLEEDTSCPESPPPAPSGNERPTLP